jgi:hypothetical protein
VVEQYEGDHPNGEHHQHDDQFAPAHGALGLALPRALLGLLGRSFRHGSHHALEGGIDFVGAMRARCPNELFALGLAHFKVSSEYLLAFGWHFYTVQDDLDGGPGCASLCSLPS